jgi:phosphatidylglycerol:prolipoprotein diacylglycerol transferase
MYRILFTIGSFPIYSYGVMIALAFITGILFAMKEAKRSGENPERVLDISLYVILGALIGGRLGYVIFYLDYYLENPIKILYFRQGGLAFLGAFILCCSIGSYRTRDWKDRMFFKWLLFWCNVRKLRH